MGRHSSSKSRSRSRSRSVKSASKSRSRSRSRSPKRRSRSRSPRRTGYRSRSRSMSPDGFRIHVADLGIDCTKREIEKKFEKFGPTFEIWLARNPPCFAFIVYKYREDADEAIKQMDGEVVCKSRVRVSYARPRTKGRGRRRGFDPNMRCYQCGERGHFSRDCNDLHRKGSARSFDRFRSYRSRSRDRDRGRRRSHSRSRSPSVERKRSRSPKPSRTESESPRKSPKKKSRRSRTKSRSRSVSVPKNGSKSPSNKSKWEKRHMSGSESD